LLQGVSEISRPGDAGEHDGGSRRSKSLRKLRGALQYRRTGVRRQGKAQNAFLQVDEHQRRGVRIQTVHRLPFRSERSMHDSIRLSFIINDIASVLQVRPADACNEWLRRGAVMLKLGFIGLGNMGEGMAQNLARAGFPLTVRDLRAEPVARLGALGARCADSNFDVGQASDLVCIAVFTDEQVRQTCLPCGGDAGLIAGLPPGGIIAIHSTVPTSLSRELTGRRRSAGFTSSTPQ